MVSLFGLLNIWQSIGLRNLGLKFQNYYELEKLNQK